MKRPPKRRCEAFRFVIELSLEKRNAVAKRAFQVSVGNRNETLNQSYFAVSFHVSGYKRGVALSGREVTPLFFFPSFYPGC